MKSLIKIECIENPESKKAIARKVLEERFGGLTAKHLCIDDTLEHLEKYQAEGLKAVHISSLLLLAELL